MKTSCEIIQDLIPLVKDQVASPASIKLVEEHIRECDDCKQALETMDMTVPKEINDKRVLFSIKKKLFLAMSALLLVGACMGLLFNQNSSASILTIVVGVVSIAVVGLLIFRTDEKKGGSSMERFFVGRAIGTLVVFGILGIYLLLKYVLHLF